MMHWISVLLGLILAAPACAAEPPSEPILRIDPGSHTGLIRRIATDAAGRWLVTASEDKTARVWDLRTGRLINTLRPPIGAGREGFLYAVALSPDGQTVALGGATGYEWDKTYSITLHDRATGRLLRRIGALPDAINHLAFSPDGRVLAASLWGKNGIRLFAAADGRLLAEDRDYGDSSYGVDFSSDGRLVATSYDGLLRLYRLDGERLTLLTKHAAPGGKRPYVARFSPDGRRIAVVFSDTPAVNVFDSETSYFRALDTAGVIESMHSVAWSRDGAALFAAGRTANRNGQHFIRRWQIEGESFDRALDWPVTRNSIFDIVPLPQERLAYGSADPSWGVISPRGEHTLLSATAVVDFRSNMEGFTLSHEGTRVRFGFEYGGKSPVVFDSRSRALLVDAPHTSSLSPPVLSAEGLVVTDWKNSTNPKLNGAPLALSPYETSRSLALLPGGEKFALGADWNLRVFDRAGKTLWRKPAQGVVRAVNVSTDGRWVVAAYGDGTIRWHRASDGVEQLAFYPHPDRRRWVLWSPTGYYDASPGAEELIGWHLNRGRDAMADFFPASRFRARYNRPDILAKILETGSEGRAIELANGESGRSNQTTSVAQVLPPVVEILAPVSGSAVVTPSVTLRYVTRSPDDAPVTALRARVNGQAVSLPDARNLAVSATSAVDARDIVIPIPAQDSEIQLFAENKNGVSVAATVQVVWAGARPAARDEAGFKPKLYVLAVGVSKYANAEFNLGLAAKDAQDIAAAFQQQKGGLYADVQVRLLIDAKAKRDDVVDGLDWLKRQVTARDVGVMFLAGHGVNDNTGKYYFMPHNADPERLLRTGVPQTDIKDTLNTLAGKAVFFVDTCHSGNALGTAKTRGMGTNTDAFVNELASAENGVVVFTASTGRQLSQERPEWGNGAFTKAVVEGLSGKADFQKTGRITHKALDYYVAERVKELTKGSQSPTAIAPQGVADFPLAVAR